jgi:hypothetical protein
MTMTTYDSPAVPRGLRLRRGLALPVYAIALILSYLSDALGNLAAAIAKD